MKQILLPATVKAELIQTFRVTRATLDRALKYQTDSPRANLLRAAAIQRGGRLFTGAAAEPKAQRIAELFRATCPRRIDRSCVFHEACLMQCPHGRAFLDGLTQTE